MSDSKDTREEPLYVLYGSQMGNSEQAAKDFCSLVKKTYTADYWKSIDGGTDEPISVVPTHMQLDDLLELKHAAFTKVIVIFVSSYGVGQAPLGSYRFREVAEELLKKGNSDDGSKAPLQGLKYAICGLGDSNYTTYLKNPTTINAGLEAAGATRIGEMGKGDASVLGENAQGKVVARWSHEILKPLAKEIASSETPDLKSMQEHVIKLLVKLDPDYEPPASTQIRRSSSSLAMAAAAGVAAVATTMAYLNVTKDT